MSNKKMSKRDKMLIYLCALFVFCAVTYWIAIMPCLNIITELQTSNDEAFLEIAERDEYVSALEVYRVESERIKTEYAELCSMYNGRMNPEEIDRAITTDALDSGLKIMSFTLGESSTAGLTDYYDVVYEKDETVDEESEPMEEGTEEGAEESEIENDGSSLIGEEEEGNSPVAIMPVTLEVSCTVGELFNFIDTINSNKSMEISGFQISSEDENNENISGDRNSQQSLTVIIDVNVYTYTGE